MTTIYSPIQITDFTMNRFNKLTNRLTLIAVLLLGLVLTSCDKEPKPTPQTGSERILFSTSIMNADGASGNGYLQAIGSIEAKKYDNSRGDVYKRQRL